MYFCYQLKKLPKKDDVASPAVILEKPNPLAKTEAPIYVQYQELTPEEEQLSLDQLAEKYPFKLPM